jgi:hypothetical protein
MHENTKGNTNNGRALGIGKEILCHPSVFLLWAEGRPQAPFDLDRMRIAVYKCATQKEKPARRFAEAEAICHVLRSGLWVDPEKYKQE